MTTLNSYESISNYLGNKSDRPAPKGNGSSNNTRIVRLSENAVAIRLHYTNVVVYYENGIIELNTGGWKTVTTRERMNSYSNGFSVWQEKYVWYVSFRNNKYLFDSDAIRLYPSGRVECKYRRFGENHKRLLEPITDERDKQINKLRNDIKKYCKAFVKELFLGTISKPGPGDCWHCLGMPDMDNGHIKSHIEEHYYVPTLLIKAIDDNKDKLSDIDKHNVGWGLKYHDKQPFMSDVSTRRIEKTLYDYIAKQFGLGIS